MDADWMECIFCKRAWKIDSLELELCPDCYCALSQHPDEYDRVKLEQLLKYGHFEDRNMADAVKQLYVLMRNK